MERALRRAASGLAALAVLFVVGRICLSPWPASDPVHSRWLTIEALLEDRSFAVGYRVEQGRAFRDVGRLHELRTVDVMLDPESRVFYSSKPPFLQTLYAPLVGLLARLGGVDAVSSARVPLMRGLLLLVHALPFALCLAWLLRWLLVRETPAVALVLVGVAGFGTFVTTFSNALSNHVPAALATWLCALALVRVVAGERGGVWFALAGLCAGFVAAIEYPAATLVVALLVALARLDRARALRLALPAALAPLLLSHATDVVVFGKPLFFVRRGKEWFHYPGSYWSSPGGLDRGEDSVVAYAFHFVVGHHGVLLLTPLFALAFVVAARRVFARRAGPLASVGAAGVAVGLAAFPVVVQRALDAHLFVFAALLSVPLLVPLFWRASTPSEGEPSPRDEVDLVVARVLLACALPCFAFYVAYTNNFGGITSGPRWLLWLAPLSVLALVPFARAALEDRRRLAFLLALVGFATYSTLSPGANPYRHPWSYSLYRSLSSSAAAGAEGAHEPGPP